MGDVLDEAYTVMQCKECSWYKSCILPMRFSAEDIRRQIESATPPGANSQSVDLNMQSLLAGMANAAQSSLAEGCPIFITRLRNSPKLAQRIKELMQNWSKEE